jgi:hypothetical protein
MALVIAAAGSMAAVSLPASAASLPQVQLSKTNKVPACATPGRLMGFLENRNRNIDGRFSTIAADYMRIGDELKIRWDIAFFQMMLETGNLTFKGDVSASQNNFAGLGATGKHVPGESFPDVATGVKAHLQHLLLYAGVHLDHPVAERTRKVQEWGVLTSWQKSLKGPINYDQLAQQWAPTSHRYSREISGLAEAFYGSPCRGPDPQPELLALARPGSAPAKANAADPKVASADDAPAADATAAEATASNATDTSAKPSGAELAKRAVEEARKNGSFVRAGLGAESLLPADDTPAVAVGEPAPTEKTQPPVKIINASTSGDDASGDDNRGPADAAPVEPTKKPPVKKVQTAALGDGTKAAMMSAFTQKSAKTLAPAPRTTCKVWTASYGGGHSVIIKARADNQDNYTVLDVNEGSEKREAEAYIAAYAKGGKPVGEFTNPSQALDKAFELCPDG